MGGERASTTRQRLAGKICALCSRGLDAPPWPGERVCTKCEAGRKRHRILMNFQNVRHDWHVSFLEADACTPLPRHLTFAIAEKIFDTARAGGADFTSEGRCMIEHGISIGRGSVWLHLTEAQYQKLKR